MCIKEINMHIAHLQVIFTVICHITVALEVLC